MRHGMLLERERQLREAITLRHSELRRAVRCAQMRAVARKRRYEAGAAIAQARRRVI